MENENGNTKALQIIGIIFMVAGFASAFQPLVSNNTSIWLKLAVICTMAAYIAILIYTFMGFKKEAKIFYKLFVNAFMLSQVFFLILVVREIASEANVIWSVIIQLLVFAALIALTISEDFGNIVFGKSKSLIMCVIVLAGVLVAMVAALIYNPGLYRGGNDEGTFIFIACADRVFCAIVLLIATYAKYADRENRANERLEA